MDYALGKVSTVKDWLEDHSEDAPDWKTKLVNQKLDELIRIIDMHDRRDFDRRHLIR